MAEREAKPKGNGQENGPPTRKGRETRERFRNALREVIAAEGYFNAKISDVAEKAEKSIGLFYNYYDSKEDLLAEIAEDFNDELAQTTIEPFKQGRPADEAWRDAIRIFWMTFKRRKAEMVGVFQASMTNPRFSKEWRRIRGYAIRRIVAGVKMAQAQGYAPGMDPVLAASALASMLENFAYVWLAGGGDDINGRFDEDRAIETVWQLWYHSLYWKAGAADAAPAGAAAAKKPRKTKR
ncbi:MAG: TetR/AcrR family transcriptional regulator [Rhodospirillaceae bacterium]|nr:TetR/AcrR family transcriptional regulator [Rhodospirillaceae bacterium]